MRRVLLIVALLALAAPPAQAHEGNPNFLSRVDAMPEGASVEVLNRDDRLLLRAEPGEEIVVEGYEEEPYARIAADGTVSVNTQSTAYYLNDDRFAEATVPDDIDPDGPPQWEEVDGTGRFEWHDHRMHWMSEDSLPPQVTDESKRTQIFTWDVPTSRGSIEGTLFWTPQPSTPIAFIVIGSAVVLVLCAAALIVARRRRGAEDW